jgi:hypothetical protein
LVRPAAQRIVVDKDQPANARLRILIHETIHALGVGYAEYGRERAEVIVDSVIFWRCGPVCGSGAGLSVGDGWYRRARSSSCALPAAADS